MNINKSRWLVLVALVLTILLVLYGAFDIRGNRRELEHVLMEQSRATMTALQESSWNAISSFNMVEDLAAERLLAIARLLEEIDYRSELGEDYLQQVVQENGIFRINIYDADGERVLSTSHGRQFGRISAPTVLMQLIQDKGNDELVLGFRASRFGTSRRFAVAKRRRTGGVIVINMDSESMLEFRRTIGVGQLIQRMGDNSGIHYILLQDTSAILIATSGVDSVKAIYADDFLTNAYENNTFSGRLLRQHQLPVYEVAQTFFMADSSKYLLRLGLNAQHMVESHQKAVARTVVLSILVLLGGLISFAWLLNRSNYQTLRRAYERIEAYTGNILTHMQDGVVAVDRQQKITVLNPAAKRMLNIDESVLNKSCRRTLPALCSFFEKTFETKKPAIHDNMELKVGKDTRQFEIDMNVLIDNTSSIDLVFAVIKDITERKQLEQAARRQEKMLAMGHLAAGVAHEIRNPLNAISITAQRFQFEFAPKADAEEYRQLATSMVSETRRINEIVNQFLEFARPAELHKQEFALDELFNDIIAMQKGPANEKGVTLHTDCKHDNKITADKNKMKQAILNLIRNAMDACSKGDEVILRCHNGDRVKVEITDTGAGMSKEMLSKVFDLYYTTKDNGTGLGLSIVQQIVAQHGGKLNIVSEKDKGTTVTIELGRSV